MGYGVAFDEPAGYQEWVDGGGGECCECFGVGFVCLRWWRCGWCMNRRQVVGGGSWQEQGFLMSSRLLRMKIIRE